MTPLRRRRRFTPRWLGDRGDLANLVLLLAVSLALRVPALTTVGLYRDDAWPALAARTDLRHAVRMGVTVPGFEAAVHVWMNLSRSTLWAQSPVLCASVASVAALYLLARGVGCERAPALVAGGILAVSPVSVLYATRLKQYSFDALGAAAVIAAALWVWQRPTAWVRWTLLLAASGLAALVSASVVPVGAVALVVSAWRCWGDGRQARRLAGVVLAVFVVFMAVYAAAVFDAVPPRLHALWAREFVDASGPGRFLTTAGHAVTALAAGLFYRHGPLGPLVLAAAAAGAFAWRRDVAALALGPVALAFVLAVAHRVPLGGGRTDAYLYPGIALAAALATQKLLDTVRFATIRWSAPNLAVATGIVLVAATAGWAHVREYPYPGVDMIGLQERLDDAMAPGDGIVVSPFSRYPWALVADRRPRLEFDPAYTTGFTVRDPSPAVLVIAAEYVEGGYNPEAVVPFAAGRERIWYVATDSPLSDTPAEATAHEGDAERLLIDRGFDVERRIDVAGAHADLLVRR